MENQLQRKYCLPRSTARSVTAEAKSKLRLDPRVTWSKPLERACLRIAEERGLLENGKPLKKEPVKVEFLPIPIPLPKRKKDASLRPLGGVSSQKETNKDKPLAKPRRRGDYKATPLDQSRRCGDYQHLPAPRRHTKPKRSFEPKKYSSSRRLVAEKASSLTSSPIKPVEDITLRFSPLVLCFKSLDTITEAAHSTDDDSSCSSPDRHSSSRGSSETSSSECKTWESQLRPMRKYLFDVVGSCTELKIVPDNPKGKNGRPNTKQRKHCE